MKVHRHRPESKEFVLPESCIASREQHLFLSTYRPNPFLRDPLLGSDEPACLIKGIEDTAENVYYKLVVFGLARLQIAEEDFLFYEKNYRELVENCWKRKRLPIPGYRISLLHNVLPDEPFFWNAIHLELYGTKSIIDEKIEITSDTPHEIIGVINIYWHLRELKGSLIENQGVLENMLPCVCFCVLYIIVMLFLLM